MHSFIRWVHTASRVSGVLAALLIFVSLCVVCHMVFTRAVLGLSSIWQTEFVIFSLIAATFIGSPYIMLTRGHVNVDIIPLMSSHGTRMKLAWLAYALSLVFCVLFLYGSVHWWLGAWETNETTPSIWKARLWIPYASVPIGLFFLCLQLLADMLSLAAKIALPFGLKPEEGL